MYFMFLHKSRIFLPFCLLLEGSCSGMCYRVVSTWTAKPYSLQPTAYSLLKTGSRVKKNLKAHCHALLFFRVYKVKAKAVPLHATKALGWRGGSYYSLFRLCQGSNLFRPVVQPVARHYIDWATQHTSKERRLLINLCFHAVCIGGKISTLKNLKENVVLIDLTGLDICVNTLSYFALGEGGM
jgi:hypothetical protein